jgi:hypothetical protein
MVFAHEGDNGFWVATADEVAAYLGYPVGHFGAGYIAGRWTGAHTQRVYRTLGEAVASEPLVPDNTVARGNPSNALGEHLGRLAADD